MITAAAAPVVASSNHTAIYVTVCALLTVFAICAVLYQHERRADRHEAVTNDHDAQLALLAGRVQALAEWLGVEVTDPEDDSPEAMAELSDDTDEIPIVLPETEPMAVINPTPAVQARRDAAWDETRPSPVPRKSADWVEQELERIRARIDAAQEAS